MDAMADFLRQAARDNGIPLTNAAVVLPSTEVFTRELTMPAMTEEDTRVTATLRVDEQAFTLSVPYGTAPTAEDVARLLTDNGISPDTIDSWTPDITQPLYADTAFTAVRKTADSGKSFTDTITLSVDGLDDVSAVFTMAPNYDITIVLHLAGGGDSDCRLVLTLRETRPIPLSAPSAAAVAGSAMSPRPQQRSPGRRTTPPSKRRRSYQKAEQHPRRNTGRDAGLHPDHRTDLRVSDHRRRLRRQDQR